MLFPASTGTGLAEFVTDRSAEFPTWTLATAVLLALFGSLDVAPTVTVSVMVEPEATFVFTFTTNVKVAVALAASMAFVQVNVTLLHTHPAGPVRDTIVVLAGSASVRVMLLATAGPPLVTTCVYVMLFPA